MQKPRTLREAALAVMGLLLLVVLWSLRGPLSTALLPLVLAVGLAYLLNPLVDALDQRRVPRPVAILLIYCVLGASVGLLITYTVPRVASELTRLSEKIPEFTASLTQTFLEWEERLQRSNFPPVFQDIIERNIMRTQEKLLTVLENTFEALLETFGRIFVIFLTPILTFYLLKDLHQIKRSITLILPGKRRRRLLAWLTHIDRTLGSWIRGQILIAFTVGLLTALGLKLIKLEFAVLLGVIAGIFDVIPYFGPFIGGIPPVIIGLIMSPAMGLKALLVIVIVQQIESNLITPLVMGHSLGLHPLVVIVALLIGGQVAGFWGLVLAVPTAAIIKVTLEHLRTE